MSIDTKTKREDETERATRHAREIQDIIDEHTALAAGKDGRELIAVREKCSRLVRETCTRHVAESNTLPPVRVEGSDANGDLGGPDLAPDADDPNRMRTAG